MVAPTYTHEQMSAMLEQFKLVPPKLQADFLAHVASNPELSGNPQVLAGAMQGVINQAAQIAAPGAHPFAAMLANTQLSPDLLAMNAPKAAHAVSLTVPGQQRSRTDGWEMT